MKAQNLKLYLLLSLLLIYQINSLSTVSQDIIHIDSEYTKAAVLEDKGVCILSKRIGENKFIESKLNKKGDLVYSYFVINQGYSASAQLVQPHSVNGKQPDNFLSHHNKQNIDGKLAKEFYTEFSRGAISRKFSNKNIL